MKKSSIVLLLTVTLHSESIQKKYIHLFNFSITENQY